MWSQDMSLLLRLWINFLFQRCMNLLDVGARESLSDVISKVLRKVANQPEGKDEELDDTLLTWSVVVWEWELTTDLNQYSVCQMHDDSAPFLFKQDSSETYFDDDCRPKWTRDECHFSSLEPACQSHSICKALYSLIKLLMHMSKHNVSWAGALLSNSSLSVFVTCYLNFVDDICDVHIVPLSQPSTLHIVSFL